MRPCDTLAGAQGGWDDLAVAISLTGVHTWGSATDIGTTVGFAREAIDMLILSVWDACCAAPSVHSLAQSSTFRIESARRLPAAEPLTMTLARRCLRTRHARLSSPPAPCRTDRC